MDGGIISYEEATGAPPLPSAPSGPPDDTPMEGRELTVTPRGRGIVPAAPQSALDAPVGQSGSQDAARPGPAGATATPPPPGLISYEDAIAPETPHAGGILSNSTNDGYFSGAAKGAGTAAVKAVGNSLGFVGGLGNFADYLIARGEHAVTGQPVEDILADMKRKKDLIEQRSTEAKERVFGKTVGDALATIGHYTDPQKVFPAPADVSAPILKRTGEYVPTSEPGKLAQAGTEAALSMIGPGAGAKVGTMAEVLRGGAAMAPSTFVSGALGQGVTDYTGDPLLGMATGLAAGPVAQGGAAAIKKVGTPAVMGIPGIDRVPFLGARVAEARDAAAARNLLHQSSDPEALKDWASQPAAASEVPESPRTTAGTVGTDRGLFQAEKDARNKDNLPFNAIDDAQAAAQKQAITAPYQEGDVFRPGQVIRDRLNAIDAAAEEAQAKLRAAHEEAVSGRKATDQQSLDRLTLAFQDAHDRAAQASVDAASPLRDLPPAEQTGAILRTAQQEATAAAEQAYKHLYDAVDPDGTLTTVVTPLKEAARSIKTSIDPLAGVQPSGAEGEIHSAIHRLPDVIPFRSLQKLDSRVTAAMADARKNPNPNDPEVISRLTQLKSATMAAIHDGVENQAAHEAKLVEAGALAPEETMRSRFADWIDGHYARRADASVARVAGGGGGPIGQAGRGSTGFAGGDREAGSGRSGSGGNAGDQGISPAARSGAQQPEVTGGIAYQAPAFGDRSVSARMHGPEVSEALGADVPGTMVRPFSGPLDRSTNQPQGIVAYHGTPHEFERFSSAGIGTGEGNQAYGHGLYFAENHGVAKGYQDALAARGADFRANGQSFKRSDLSPIQQSALDHITDVGGIDKAIAETRTQALKDDKAHGVDWNRRLQVLQDWKESGFAPGGEGHLYQVRIGREPDHFLDWDKPLGEQSPYVKEKLRSLGIDTNRVGYGKDVYERLSGYDKKVNVAKVMLSGGNDPTARLKDLFPEMSDRQIVQTINAAKAGKNAAGAVLASDMLKAEGIAGIKYLDAGSRGAGDGSRNFVTFDDRDIQVTHRNGQPLVRPVSLPDYLKGEARGAFVKELASAGMSPAMFSKDLKVRADRLLKDGASLDHGTAFGRSYMERASEHGTLGQGVPRGRGELPQEGGSGVGSEEAPGVPGSGLGRGSAGEAGRASSQGLTANITPEARERLKAAKAAYSAYQQTFKNPVVKGILETNGFAGQFRTPDSAIPSKWVVAGDKGYEVAQAFLAASANDPRAVAAMQNASLTLLRKNMPPVGNLHPNALARWKETLAGALRAIDEVSPGFSSRFDSPANATQALLDLGAQQKQQLADFQRQAATRALEHDAASKATMQSGIARSKAIVSEARNSPAGKFLGQGGDRISPVEVENAVGNMLKTGTQGASRMHSLVGSIANDPDAIAGLRKGGTDWMARTFSRSDDALSGAAFIKFIRDNRDVLKELYPTGHVSMLGAVARDMEVNARWRTQTAIKGGSDTVKNHKPMFSEGFKEVAKHTSMMTAAIEGLQAGYEIGGVRGAAVAAAAPTLYLLHSLRSAGIKSVDDLYREALADPEKARLLISKMPETVEGGKLRALTGLLRKGLIVGPAQTRQIETQPDPTRPPVLSPEEAEALPSGAIFRTLDGRTRVRH